LVVGEVAAPATSCRKAQRCMQAVLLL
jgi:hypothetical protein